MYSIIHICNCEAVFVFVFVCVCAPVQGVVGYSLYAPDIPCRIHNKYGLRVLLCMCIFTVYDQEFRGRFTKCTFSSSHSLSPHPTCPADMCTHFPLPLCGPIKTSMVCFSCIGLRRPSTNSSSTQSNECYMNIAKASMNKGSISPILFLFLFILSVC